MSCAEHCQIRARVINDGHFSQSATWCCAGGLGAIQILKMHRQLRFIKHCLFVRAGACWCIA